MIYRAFIQTKNLNYLISTLKTINFNTLRHKTFFHIRGILQLNLKFLRIWLVYYIVIISITYCMFLYA